MFEKSWKNFIEFFKPEKVPILENFKILQDTIKSAKAEIHKNFSDPKQRAKALSEKLNDVLSDDAKQLAREVISIINNDGRIQNRNFKTEIEALFDKETKSIFKDVSLPKHQSLREVIRHFCSFNPNWPVSRQLLGFVMVHSPEYPTYFIPAFTQAKATGEAKELKKGEGIRGIITGCLEGIAVGAIVSGKKFKMTEMLPYMACGAALQYFSSKVFPVLGEKCGQFFYKEDVKKHTSQKINIQEVSYSGLQKPSTKTISANSNVFKNFNASLKI